MKKLKISLSVAAILMGQLSFGQITSPAPYCAAGFDDDFAPVPHYISNVTLGTLNNTTGTTQFAAPHYAYYNALTAPNLTAGTSYPVSIGNDGGVTIHFLAVYIDYNHNNSFADAGERVFEQTGMTGVSDPATGTIAIPLTAATGTTRMRVILMEDDPYTFGGATHATPCTADGSTGGSLDWGETEDYNVNIVAATAPVPVPVAGFKVNVTTGTASTVFNFTDTSSHAPTTRKWTFTPGTVAYQGGTNNASANPSVKFTSSGSYTVKLVVTNAGGKDSVTKTAYVAVTNTTTVNDVYDIQRILIYPNPARGSFAIGGDCAGAEMSIVNVQGKLVMQRIVSENTIDITSLTSGIYFVRIVKEDSVYTQLLSVEK